MAHIHSVYDTDAHFKIDAVTRVVKNASETKTMVVQNDHNSERFTFELPRLAADNHDMSKCNSVQVHYNNVDARGNGSYSGIYEVDDFQISPESNDTVIFSWLISRNATQYVGKLSFAIRFVCSQEGEVDYEWNTVPHNGVFVSDGINNSDEIEDEFSDILIAHDDRIRVLEQGGVPGSGGNADLTPPLKKALVDYYTHVMPNFDDANGLTYINAILTALGAETREEPEEPDEPDEPDTPVVTLSSISATYSGGDVAVGTAVSDLTGIVVTAHYSDSTSKDVTGYTLSGTIAEGNNTITVSYGGKTATFSVTGVAESGGEPTVVNLNQVTYSWPDSTEYSDGGETVYSGVMGTLHDATMWYSEPFEQNTVVAVSVLYGATNANLRQYCGCVYSEQDFQQTGGSQLTVHFMEQIGTASTSEYTAEYTVRAGYRLAVINYNSGKPQSLVVTK